MLGSFALFEFESIYLYIQNYKCVLINVISLEGEHQWDQKKKLRTLSCWFNETNLQYNSIVLPTVVTMSMNPSVNQRIWWDVLMRC